MKNTVMSMLLGFFIALSISSTVLNITSVKQVNPKTTIVFWEYEDYVETTIKKYIKQGYVVKTVTQSRNSGILVVMEKY